MSNIIDRIERHYSFEIDNGRKASLLGRHNEVSSNPSALRTGVRNIMYAHTVPIYNPDFFDIKRRILVVIEHAPQFINRLFLREGRVAGRNNQKEQPDFFHRRSTSAKYSI